MTSVQDFRDFCEILIWNVIIYYNIIYYNIINIVIHKNVIKHFVLWTDKLITDYWYGLSDCDLTSAIAQDILFLVKNSSRYSRLCHMLGIKDRRSGCRPVYRYCGYAKAHGQWNANNAFSTWVRTERRAPRAQRCTSSLIVNNNNNICVCGTCGRRTCSLARPYVHVGTREHTCSIITLRHTGSVSNYNVRDLKIKSGSGRLLIGKIILFITQNF